MAAIAGRSARQGSRVDLLPGHLQKDVLVESPARARSPAKKTHQLNSPKKEKSTAEKRRSVNQLKEVLKSWEPGAPLEPDVLLRSDSPAGTLQRSLQPRPV